jgi:predicted nucleic acid-binding protein
MDAWVWVLIVVVAVVIIAIVAALIVRRRQRRHSLRERLGPEYDRAVEGQRRGKAERHLDERVKQREQLEIRPLSENARERYARQWSELQSRFVDRPESAVDDADALVAQVMREQGYPVEDFESQAELISVDHPHVVENYRSAHGTYVRNTQQRASTEELREAVVCYRSLFDELLSDSNGRQS